MFLYHLLFSSIYHVMRHVILYLLLLSLSLLQPDAKRHYYWLDQEMIDSAGGSFVVSKAYSLLNDTIVFPPDFKLIFDGGTLGDGVIVGNESSVVAKSKGPFFGLGITIKGTWNQKEVYDEWFVFKSDTTFASNTIIENMLALTDDDHQTHIFFNADRVCGHCEQVYLRL